MYHLSIHIGSIQVHLTPMAVNKVTDLPANKQWKDQFLSVQKRSLENISKLNFGTHAPELEGNHTWLLYQRLHLWKDRWSLNRLEYLCISHTASKRYMEINSHNHSSNLLIRCSRSLMWIHIQKLQKREEMHFLLHSNFFFYFRFGSSKLFQHHV